MGSATCWGATRRDNTFVPRPLQDLKSTAENRVSARRRCVAWEESVHRTTDSASRCLSTHEVSRMMEAVTVLILVRDTVGAGLFAALIEGTGLTPLFAFPGERAELAVERLRPTRILLECQHPASRADAFFHAARAAGSRIVLFAPATPWKDCDEIARVRSVAAFVHWRNGQSLADLVRTA